MLKKLLEHNKAFKLITGAGNENLEQIEKLITIYSQAGGKFFDICADLEVLKTAKNTLRKLGKDPSDFAFCVSLGIKDDPHIQKAKINSESCIECKTCINSCSQSAITQELNVIEENCIGCKACFNNCPSDSISFYNKEKNIEEVIPRLIEEGIDAIELHANSFNEEEAFQKWEYLNSNFDGILSLCLDRSNLSTNAFCQRIEKALKNRKPYTTIIQADGNPMSGTNEDYKTTLEAIATAKIVAEKNYLAYLLISGGTNDKTAEMAKLCNIKPNGIAYGSYARKIVQNKDLKSALQKARELVELSSLSD